jgi:hypothetical protein
MLGTADNGRQSRRADLELQKADRDSSDPHRRAVGNGLSTDEAERVLTQELGFLKILNEQLRAKKMSKNANQAKPWSAHV